MKNHQKLSSILTALALTAGMAMTASAQSTGGDSGSGGQGGGKTANDSFSNWMRDHGSRNQGRISRQAYMDEAARRWDSMDRTKQGLTYDEINRLYWSSAVGMGGPTATSPNEKKGIQR